MADRSAEDGARIAADNLALARRWIGLISTRDLEALEEMLPPDHLYTAVWRNPESYGRRRTKAEFLHEITDWGPHTETPVTMKITSELATPDRVVLEAEGEGVMRGGYVYANSYCFIFWISGGRIDAIHDYCCTNTGRLLEEHLRTAFPEEENLFDTVARQDLPG